MKEGKIVIPHILSVKITTYSDFPCIISSDKKVNNNLRMTIYTLAKVSHKIRDSSIPANCTRARPYTSLQ